MRVLQVIDSLEVGGAERIFVMLSNMLYMYEIEVTVVLLVSEGDLFDELHSDIPIIRLNRKKRLDLKVMKQFVQVMKDFDLVHVHLKHNFRYASLSAKFFKMSSSKIIFHDHSHSFGINTLSVKNIKDSFFKTILKPKYYIGVSKENCLWAETYLKISKPFIYLLENTITYKLIETSNNRRDGIVLVSNISRVKNLSFALNLIKSLKMHLTIFGQIRDNSYHQELLDLIEELGLNKQITIVSDCKNIQAELYKYEFALHTSLKETGPLVLIEYLAQGLPFLSFGSGQVYEKLQSIIPESFIDTFDIKLWKKQISVIRDIESSRLKKIYETYYSEEKYLDKCLKIYQHILSS